MGDYKGRTGLSPHAAYPSTMEREMYSPISPYPSTMLAYIETTQIPPGPWPYGSTGKELRHTRRHNELPSQLSSNSTHITYIIGIRAKLRWRFIVPLGVTKFFTCRSIGSGTQGDLGSFCIRKCGAWVWRDRWMHCPFPWLRGRRQVVIALFVPCIPLCSTGL